MSDISVNSARISRRIATLSEITEDGRPWTRTAFSKQHMKAREWLVQEMQDVGLQTRMDGGGNLIGELAGRDNDVPIMRLGLILKQCRKAAALTGSLA